MAEEQKVSVDEVSNISESGSLKSNENSISSFYKWDEYREPIEIKCPGRYVLSDTENGKSIVFYDPDFFEEDKTSTLMDLLLNTTNWQAKNVTIRGVEYRQPRLVAWYGPFPYSYSGTTLEPAEMPFYIFQIKKKVERYLIKHGVNVKLNSVLLNRYRNHKDSVSWHSDDESSMGICPTIASVSLGDTRRFEMRRKLKFFGDESSYSDEIDDYFILLNNGSLLIMDGSMQEDWEHRVPKEYCHKEERINLTFRTVYKVERILHSPKAQVKRSLESVTKVHRKKISYGKTSDTDAESEGSVTESNKPENKSPSLKVEDSTTCEDAESESALEKLTKPQRENSSFDKTLDIDVKSEGSGAVCKIEDFQSPIEIKKPVEKNTKSSLKVEGELCGDEETNSYKHFTLKTEEVWIESDEDDDIIEIPYRKRTTSPVAKKGVKNIGTTDSVTGKNKRICISRQSIETNSLNNTVQKDFKKKTESTRNADSRQTLSESCENNTFDSCELRDLLNFKVHIMNRMTFLNYTNALKNQILRNIKEFSLPAKAELEILCELTHGSQTEDNQKIITRRMLSVVDKALKLPQGGADNKQTSTESCENETSG